MNQMKVRMMMDQNEKLKGAQSQRQVEGQKQGSGDDVHDANNTQQKDANNKTLCYVVIENITFCILYLCFTTFLVIAC